MLSGAAFLLSRSEKSVDEFLQLMHLSGMGEDVAEETAAIVRKGLGTAEGLLDMEEESEEQLLAYANTLLGEVLKNKARASVERALALGDGDLAAAEEGKKSIEASDAELQAIENTAVDVLKKMKEEATTETLRAIQQAGEEEILAAADVDINRALLKKARAEEVREAALNDGDLEAAAEAENMSHQADDDLADAQEAAAAALGSARSSVSPQVALDFAQEELREAREEASAAQEVVLDSFSEGGDYDGVSEGTGGSIATTVEAVDAAIEEKAAAAEVKEAAAAAGDFQAMAEANTAAAEAEDAMKVAEEVALDSLAAQNELQLESVRDPAEEAFLRGRRQVGGQVTGKQDAGHADLNNELGHGKVRKLLHKLDSYVQSPFLWLKRKLFRRSE